MHSQPTLVKAEPSNFRQVVQKLTGASQDSSLQKLPLILSKPHHPPPPTTAQPSMMNEQPLNAIMEVREDFMLSPAGGDTEPTLRTAHFLKPISYSIHESPFGFNPSSMSYVFDPKEWPLKFHFRGWHQLQDKWVGWVDQLKPKYKSVWKKVGVFEAIMSTKCRILKDQNLLYGVVEKWCCETNTFVFPFGEATITLEDVMVLGGYPVIGDPIFTKVKDQEMREVENKLILPRQQLTRSENRNATTSRWMDIFIDKGSEIEHEAFLSTWLSFFVFPHRYSLVKISLFPIAIHLARGNPIALAPAVLASIYNDLTLFKKTIVDLSKYPVGSDRYPLEVTLQSPFYLVQIWVWERFKNLQPQPMLINHEDPLLFRWHEVQTLQIDNVKLELDSAINDFLWRPYFRYAENCDLFYPNDAFLVPFKKDTVSKKMLSFVICLRVSELVGFDSIEQYLPHRVAMQFGMDQDVPSDVPRFNKTKITAWKYYCRLISDKNLYFPPRLFEADVTTRYAMWWKQSVLGHGDFVKNIVKRKRSESSRKHRPHQGKTNRSSNDVGVPPGFPLNLVDFLKFGKFCDDVPTGNSSHVCTTADENIDAPSMSVEDCKPVLKSKHLINRCSSSSLSDSELSIGSLEKKIEDANGSKEGRMSCDRVCLSETQAESKHFSIRKKVSLSNNVAVAQKNLQFRSDISAQAQSKEEVEENGRKESDHEALVLLKVQYLKNQEELERLARQQDEMLRLMHLKMKRDELLRQFLTSFLKNQPPPPSSS